MMASGALAPAEGAYLPPADVARVSTDLNAGLSVLSARRDSAWLPQIPAELIIHDSPAGGVEQDASCSAPQLYLLGGSGALDAELVERLPQPPGRRRLPNELKGKDFFGGPLSYTGYNVHLIPPQMLSMLPVSARCFVYYDAPSHCVRVVDEPTTHGYPKAQSNEFSMRRDGTAPLMVALTPVGVLLLMLQGYREAVGQLDQSLEQLVGNERRVAASSTIRDAALLNGMSLVVWPTHVQTRQISDFLAPQLYRNCWAVISSVINLEDSDPRLHLHSGAHRTKYSRSS